MNGYDIIFTFKKSKDRASALIKKISSKSHSNKIDSFQLDLNNLGSIRKFFDTISNRNNINVLVNNAAYTKNISNEEILKLSDADIIKIVNSNISGTFLFITQFIDKIAINSNDNFNIINIGSNSTKTLNASNLLYMASKAAIENFTKSFAKIYGNRVRVNCVSPGLMYSNITKRSPDLRFKMVIDKTPLERLCEPNDISDAVFSIINEMKFMNGEIITIDGGRSI